jgi:hypothetical protein
MRTTLRTALRGLNPRIPRATVHETDESTARATKATCEPPYPKQTTFPFEIRTMNGAWSVTTTRNRT